MLAFVCALVLENGLRMLAFGCTVLTIHEDKIEQFTCCIHSNFDRMRCISMAGAPGLCVVDAGQSVFARLATGETNEPTVFDDPPSFRECPNLFWTSSSMQIINGNFGSMCSFTPIAEWLVKLFWLLSCVVMYCVP